MRTKNIKIMAALLVTIVLTAIVSCKKDNKAPVLSSANIYFQEAAAKDSVNFNFPLSDSLRTLKLHPLSKSSVSGNHTLAVGIDTSASRLADCRAKYGKYIKLLPIQLSDAIGNITPIYHFAHGTPEVGECRISNGGTQFEDVQINFLNGTHLDPTSTYVLPIVIKTLDDVSNNASTGQVVYVIIRVKSIYGIAIDRSLWTVVDFSSAFNTKSDTFSSPILNLFFPLSSYPASNVLDGDLNTYWVTNHAPAQYFTIDMGQQTTFSKVLYYYDLSWQQKVDISTSDDGVNWTSRQTFSETSTTQSPVIVLLPSAVTARYLKFTVVSEVNTGAIAAYGYLIAIKEFYAYQ